MGDSKMEKLIAELEAMMQYELYKAKKDHLHGQFFALRAETLAYTIALLKEREKTESKAQGEDADRMNTYRYYRYGYLLRPPGLGCQPRDGLIRTREQEGETLDGYHLWGFAIYDRPLPDGVMDHYDLVFLDSWEFDGPIPDNFKSEGEKT